MLALQNRNAPKELSVSELFSGVEYVVPIYQRNYAWEDEEIVQLIEDIADTDNEYYLGSLIVNQRDANVYEVIDGQQRLTTLFLLMIWLEEDASEHKAKLDRTTLRFEAREKSNRTLREIKKDFQGGEWYSDEIVDGFRAIEKYFDKKNAEAGADARQKSFTEKIRERLFDIKIIRTPVPEKIDLNHYFEIMNTRGEQLELHEIVKYYLLKALESGDDVNKEKDKRLASDIWNACSRMDRYVQMNFPSDMREKIFGENWENFCVKSFADLRDNCAAAENPSEKKASLSDILEGKVDFNSNAGTTLEENERFESILSFPNFLLQVNAAMCNAAEEDEKLLDDKKLLELLEDHWTTGEKAQEFLFSLLQYRYYFDMYVIKREFAKDYKEDGKWSLKALKGYAVNGKNRKTANFVLTYGDEQKEESRNNEKMKMLQSCLRVTYTSPKTMHWLARLLRELASFPAKEAASHHISLLEKYASDKVKESKFESASGFKFGRIVFTYLDYLLWRDDAEGKFKSFQFQFRNSIEHFYPQHPLNKIYWNEESLNDFGNLALLTVSANSRFSNLSPAEKIDSSRDVVQQSPKLMLMAELMGADGWNQEKAKKHGIEMKDNLRKAIEN